MRYLSQIFQPVITIPKGAKIKNTEITCRSQKLLLECGLVRPTSSGFFTILPLARRVLDKLENLIRHHIEAAGGQRVSLPCLTSARLWEKTGRLEEVGTELLLTEDRHKKKYLLSPTHEEAIADLLADAGPLSYKQLPTILYQITNKYRDEYRPKHGLLRAREFTMLDAYGAHASAACAESVYSSLTEAYRDIFRTLQLPVYKVQAPTGEMGGTLSHEWQLPAEAGEDELGVCPSCSHAALAHEGDACGKCGRDTERCSSIEVGHTFVLGTRYSAPLRANFATDDGKLEPIVMSCYGIGITRLLAASVEALSSDTSLRWPKAIAPYTIAVIGPKEGSKEWTHHGRERIADIAATVENSGFTNDVIVDDRHSLTIGKRLMMADKMGHPYTIVCGRSATETPPRYELYAAGDKQPQLLTLSELCTTLTDTRLADSIKC